MQVPAGVVYSAFGVTILIAAVLLLRAVTSLRRHFLNFHDGLEWPDGDPARRPSGSTETRLVLNGDPVDQVDDVPLPPPPPRVSLPEWVGGGGGEGAAKRVPPLSLVQLDKACPAAVPGRRVRSAWMTWSLGSWCGRCPCAAIYTTTCA